MARQTGEMGMKLRHLQFVGCVLALPALAADPASPSSADALRDWPQWRGPLAAGVAPFADPPVHWSETNNVRWKFPLPGKGHSSPVVFGDRIFVTAAVPVGDRKSTRLNSSHVAISYAVFCLKKK